MNLTMIVTWVAGALRRRAGRLAVTATGIAVTVGFVAGVGTFLTDAERTMTARAARGVAIDWQVAVRPPAPATAAATARTAQAVQRTAADTPAVRHAVPVGFATTTGLSAVTGATTQTTGSGVVLGVPPGYAAVFPDVIRYLVGAHDTTHGGVLLAQQTAANLHATPGDTITLGRSGLTPVAVRVDGIVDLPQADSLFQVIGAPTGSQPVAPPDNVVLLDDTRWHQLFDPLAAVHPDQVSQQVHVALDHTLPTDPATAYTRTTQAARNFETRTTGTGVVGDNLASTLDAARSDAAYARLLFLFLGAPAVAIAALLTATVVGTGAERRRREQALLRTRGATTRQALTLAGTDAALVGLLGAAAGLGLAALTNRLVLHAPDPITTGWAVAAAVAGVVVAALTVLVPAWRDLRTAEIAAARHSVAPPRTPLWRRCGLDLLLLLAAILVFTTTGGGNHQLVLAPEGSPTISVSYWAFAAPALLWTGAALLALRLLDLALGPGRRLVGAALAPIAGNLSRLLANSIARRRGPLSRAVVLLGLALTFAASTATFNATYQTQAEVDAQLTNGADVTVTEPPGATVPANTTDTLAALAAVPGVHGVEPLHHHFAYVGTDLQDLYGVRPATITGATTIQDTYFQGGTASQLMRQLATHPDSLLVSAETVTDFQLHPGDTINLRVQDSRTRQLTTVPFHYIGVVTEFPTAPKDSFLVANADYLTQHTGATAAGTFLINTGGTGTTDVTHQVQALLGPTATVTDIATTRATIGSSLTAVDLSGLTHLELAYGVLLAVAAAALVLTAGLAERRRTLAIATALGATRRHRRPFITTDTAILTTGGLLTATLTTIPLTALLITELTGVFDPPPSTTTIPWTYLILTTATVLVGLATVTALTLRSTTQPTPPALRDR